MKWSESDTIKFVEVYRDHECLWNTANVYYTNKHMRTAAYEAIVQKIGKEGFGVAELKQKIKNLRCTYNQEVNKINKSSVNGSPFVYIPSLKWFNIMDAFIKTIKDQRQVQNSMEYSKTIYSMGNIPTQDNLGNSPNHDTQIKEEIEQVEETMCTPVIQNPRTTTRKVRPTKRRLQELTEAVNELRSNYREFYEAESSENEAFGKYVALALKKMPLSRAILAQSEIQAVLTRYRLGAS